MTTKERVIESELASKMSLNSKRAGNLERYLTDGSQISAPLKSLIILKIRSIFIIKMQPIETPQMVPKTPTTAPHIKNILKIEPVSYTHLTLPTILLV